MIDNRLAFLIHPDLADRPKLQRTLLRDQVIERLRNHIVSGQFPPGTKLVEREAAEWLGVSRAPVRDALIQLEKEGLVESRPTGRHVIELTKSDIRELYQVRHALEHLAVELAAQNTDPEKRALLAQCLEALHQAVVDRDHDRYVVADVEMHWSIWRQAGNRHLFRMLSSMVGPIFMFVANNIKDSDWNETFWQHEGLVKAILAGDAAGALVHLDRHLDDALRHSIRSWKSEPPR